MYKKRNDIQDGISTKDILEHWNEELAHEFSDFKYVDIEQIGSDDNSNGNKPPNFVFQQHHIF